jgi:hypothetical protein
MSIIMIPVESSQIDSIGHDPRRNEMKVRFKNGGTYLYRNVTMLEFEKLRLSESVGSFFSMTFKKDPVKYPYSKVEG